MLPYRTPDQLIRAHASLKGERGNTENVWQAIADIMIPLKNNIQETKSPGEARYNNIYNSTAQMSLEYLAGALHGMLTSPTSFFFDLSTGDPNMDNSDAVRKYLQAVVRVLHDLLNQSNFQSEVHEYYIDLCGFGNGALFLEEDIKDVIRFQSWPLNEVYVDENSKGRIDCSYRMFKLDARGVVDEFGEQAAPQKVKDALKNGKNDKFEILHSIYPRQAMAGQAPTPFKFLSHYVFVPDKSSLMVSGFREFPLLFGRWSKVSGEIYGRGAGERALPDAKTLEAMSETTLVGAQKAVDPPMQAPDDGFVLPYITTPGGLNFYRAGSQDRMEPIFKDTRVDFGFQMIEMAQNAIREAFYINQLQLRESDRMTATEVSQRVEQALRFLAPMLGRQQSEFLGPMVERLYAIADRRGLLPEVPEELSGRPLKIVYSSVMAMAQRQSEMQNINRTFAGIAPLTSMNPNVMDNFDTDNGARYIAKLHNFPQEMLRDQKQVGEMRQARAEADQAAAAQDQMATEAKTMSDVLNSASKFKVAQAG